MNQTTHTRSLLTFLNAVLRTVYALRPRKETLGYFAVSLLLCGVSPGFGAVSVGICPLTVCAPAYIMPCTLGAVAGYGLFWGFGASFGNYSILAITVCARLLFPKAGMRYVTRLGYLIATAAIGALFVIAEDFRLPSLLQWGIGLVSAAGCVLLFPQALEQKSNAARLCVACLVVLGLGRVHLPGGSAAICAIAWVCAAPSGLLIACALSTAMTVAMPNAELYAAIFALSAMMYRLTRKKHPLIGACSVCGVYFVSALRLGSIGFALYASGGALAALLLPPTRFLPAPKPATPPETPVKRSLERANHALRQAAAMLHTAGSDRELELAAILDDACTQVCRSCAKYAACWQENGQAMYAALDTGAAVILSRGEAYMEDLPLLFRTRCIHQDAFLTGMNDALADSRARRRMSRRLREAALAAENQYELIGDYLQRLSDRLYAPKALENYTVELSVQAAGRDGSAVSGDRGAAFAAEDGSYYVLLCDGMGTGTAAAIESDCAAKLLRKLLLAGMEPSGALHALNDIYLLRDNGCFSTVDLLRIDCTSGNATLYKWGAAPSYLKRPKGARLLGGATLPPGTGEGSEMETIRLSLEHGCTLILLSDGLSGKETKRRLEACESLRPRDITASIFAGRQPPEDDCTAVAVCLRREVGAAIEEEFSQNA